MFDPITKEVITDKDGKFETTVTINGSGINSVNVSASVAGSTATTSAKGTPTPPSCNRPRFTITLPGVSTDRYSLNFKYLNSASKETGNSTTTGQGGLNRVTIGAGCAATVLFFIYQFQLADKPKNADAQLEGYTLASGPYDIGGVWMWRFNLDT